MLFNGKAAQKVVFLHVQHILSEGYTGSNNFRYAALYKFFCKFRVFQLVTDGHFIAGTDQFCEVVFKGMVREPGHCHGPLFPIGFFGLNQPQNLYGSDCIV